jgi:DNA-binding NarL/FixJ family response regulator
MGNRLTVVMIESAYLLQAGMEQLFNEIPGLVLLEVFEGSEKSLSEKIAKLNPDILVINPNSLKTNFVPFINDVNKNPDCLTIGLFNSSTPENVKSHFKGCLNLSEGKFELLENLKYILGEKITKKPKVNNSVLSEREKTIVTQVVNGLTNQEIADKLFLSIHTITTHRKNISNKLGIKTVSGLTVYALMNKIVDLNEIDHR